MNEIEREHDRQVEKWGEQNHLDGTGSRFHQTRAKMRRHLCEKAAANGCLTWAHILDEEFSEALAETYPQALREELIQVAAVCVSWIEAIERRLAESLVPPNIDYGVRVAPLVREAA